MPKRTVTCSKCHATYQQDVDTSAALKVDNCKTCGGFGIMTLGPGLSLTQLPQPGIPRTNVMDCRMLERALSDSVNYRQLIVGAFTTAGYAFIGFHGCGYNSACSIIRGGIDPAKNTVGARGRGFYVGSLRTGIPNTWAQKAQRKGDGLATILAIYVSGFQSLQYGVDYDWGMMDGDDKVDTAGLEIVFYGNACKRLCAVHASGNETTTLWNACPHDSLSAKDRLKLEPAAKALNITSTQLAEWISKETLAKHLTESQMQTLAKFMDE